MQKGFVIGWVLVLVLFLITLAGANYYWQQKNIQLKPTTVPINYQTPTPESIKSTPATSSAGVKNQH